MKIQFKTTEQLAYKIAESFIGADFGFRRDTLATVASLVRDTDVHHNIIFGLMPFVEGMRVNASNVHGSFVEGWEETGLVNTWSSEPTLTEMGAKALCLAMYRKVLYSQQQAFIQGCYDGQRDAEISGKSEVCNMLTSWANA